MMRRSHRGVTLIELVVLITLSSVAALGLLQMFGQAGRNIGANDDLQTANQLAQDCIEYILEVRRRKGYPYAVAADCPVLPTDFSAFSRAVTFSNATTPPCPLADRCNVVDVRVSRGLQELALFTVLIADYDTLSHQHEGASVIPADWHEVIN